jgi:ketosteroid isomerase-like protein
MLITDSGSALAFASQWIKNWNNRDVEAVLSHFHEACTFESPLAKTYAGSSVISGKQALRAYWTSALARIETLKFELETATWDQDKRTLVVFSVAHLNGRVMRACEAMIFDASGLQQTGRAYYGYVLD